MLMIWFVFLFCLLFSWGVLHRVLFVVVWCQVLYSSGFLFMSSHYLILPSVTSEKAMATHSSTLAWKIPWMEKPGRLQSMGTQRVRHDWVTSLSLSGVEVCYNWLVMSAVRGIIYARHLLFVVGIYARTVVDVKDPSSGGGHRSL